MSEKPFWAGKNVKILFFLMDKKVLVDVPNWTVKAEGVEVADGICGENRDRLDFILNHYSVSLSMQMTDVTLLRKLLDLQRERDLNVALPESAVGFLIYPNNATSAAFQARSYCVGGWDVGTGGRTERNKVTLPGRAQYFDPLPSL